MGQYLYRQSRRYLLSLCFKRFKHLHSLQNILYVRVILSETKLSKTLFITHFICPVGDQGPCTYDVYFYNLFWYHLAIDGHYLIYPLILEMSTYLIQLTTFMLFIIPAFYFSSCLSACVQRLMIEFQSVFVVTNLYLQ